MAGRNAGAGTRDMDAAGRILLSRERAKKNISDSTVSTTHAAWKVFVAFAHYKGVKRMEHVSRALVIAYGVILAARVRQGERKPGYAQRLISAVNSVMRLSRTDWVAVRAVSDCRVPKRQAIREREPGGMDPDIIIQLTQELERFAMARASAVVQLAWTFGLRIKECALLDVKKALKEASVHGSFTLTTGTKGGRKRSIPVDHEQQFLTLHDTAAVQGSGRSIMASEMDWRRFLVGELNDARQTLKTHDIKCYHDLRAAYACRRYLELTGHPAPVFSGHVTDKTLDRTARQKITHELGHKRLSVTTAYLGSMR